MVFLLVTLIDGFDETCILIMLGISLNHIVIMKEQNEYCKQTKIMIDLEAQLNVIFKQYLYPYTSS